MVDTFGKLRMKYKLCGHTGWVKRIAILGRNQYLQSLYITAIQNKQALKQKSKIIRGLLLNFYPCPLVTKSVQNLKILNRGTPPFKYHKYFLYTYFMRVVVVVA